ncbi:hypothetical protein SLS64_002725 [Diaporthe eres]|uniref:Uncharacterized protein n=1 Tax=Diaporthe eres TaxID=83184 RepID=A0ABR1P4L5_DIAER
MKISPAVLALLATTAVAVPMSVADMIGGQVTTPAEKTTAPSKTLDPASPNGPGEEDEFEICVMPDGCRDEDKHAGDPWHQRTTTLVRGKTLSSTFKSLVPTTTSRHEPITEPIIALPTAKSTRDFGICLMPTGCRNETKHSRSFQTRTPSITTTKTWGSQILFPDPDPTTTPYHEKTYPPLPSANPTSA